MYKIIVLLAALVSVVAVPMAVSAMETSEVQLTDENIRQIRSNCSATKSLLERVHNSDTLLRVNLGRQYETMSMRLMSPMNSRIASNRLDGSDLVATTASYETALTRFRENYKVYEQQLSRTMQIDCRQRPVEFYDELTKSREYRKQVRTEVENLNKAIIDYQEIFVKFAETNTKGDNGK